MFGKKKEDFENERINQLEKKVSILEKLIGIFSKSLDDLSQVSVEQSHSINQLVETNGIQNEAIHHVMRTTDETNELMKLIAKRLPNGVDDKDKQGG